MKYYFLKRKQKKKVFDRLTELYPNSEANTMLELNEECIYNMCKSALDEILHGVNGKYESDKREYFDLNKPQNFSGKNSIERTIQTYYEDTCSALRQVISTDPKELNLIEFESQLTLLKEQNK